MGGIVTGGNFEYGDMVTVKAVPDSGYKFVSGIGLAEMIESSFIYG